VKLVKTEHKGFGLKVMENVKPGELVMELVGELIDNDECEKRMWYVYGVEAQCNVNDVVDFFSCIDSCLPLFSGITSLVARRISTGLMLEGESFPLGCSIKVCEILKWPLGWTGWCSMRGIWGIKQGLSIILVTPTANSRNGVSMESSDWASLLSKILRGYVLVYGGAMLLNGLRPL